MLAFRGLLIVLWVLLLAYTIAVVSRFGLGLFAFFFGDIAKANWPGQFNLDFLCFLTLSALWAAWRSAFSGLGLLLAIVAFLGGAGFLLPYLLILTLQARGDMAAVLLGRQRR